MRDHSPISIIFFTCHDCATKRGYGFKMHKVLAFKRHDFLADIREVVADTDP